MNLIEFQLLKAGQTIRYVGGGFDYYAKIRAVRDCGELVLTPIRHRDRHSPNCNFASGT